MQTIIALTSNAGDIATAEIKTLVVGKSASIWARNAQKAIEKLAASHTSAETAEIRFPHGAVHNFHVKNGRALPA